MVVKGYSIDHSFKTRSDSTVDPRLEPGRIEKKKKPVWPGWPDKIQSKTRYDLAVDPRLELDRVEKKTRYDPTIPNQKLGCNSLTFVFFTKMMSF